MCAERHWRQSRRRVLQLTAANPIPGSNPAAVGVLQLQLQHHVRCAAVRGLQLTAANSRPVTIAGAMGLSSCTRGCLRPVLPGETGLTAPFLVVLTWGHSLKGETRAIIQETSWFRHARVRPFGRGDAGARDSISVHPVPQQRASP